MPVAELSRPKATVNYEVWGDGTAPWVTLVNGHTRPLNDFRLMGRHLVEHGRRVLALDNRGAGKTVVTGPFSLDDLVGDVAALWDELGIDETDLLGISMGGFIAQTLAARHPERVRRLVLVSTGLSHRRIRRDERPWTDDPAAVEAKLKPYFTDDFARRNDALVKSMAKQIAKAVALGSFAAQSDMQKRAVAGFDGAAQARGVKAKTLVVHGDMDEIIPPAAADELKAAIPGAALEILAGAGHLLLAERPKELYGLVAKWLTP